MAYQKKHNDGKRLYTSGRKTDKDLKQFNNTRDDYWDERTNEWLKEPEVKKKAVKKK